jgi:chromosome segregation ATPase
LRTKSCTVSDTLSAVETELRTCREALERAVSDRDLLQRQAASHLLELDRLRQEKESLEMQQRVAERDLMDLRDKLSIANRSLTSATDNIASQETSICQLRGMLSSLTKHFSTRDITLHKSFVFFHKICSVLRNVSVKTYRSIYIVTCTGYVCAVV